jgi:hypothetical protein
MKISIHAPFARERFETARQYSILHPERIVGNPEVIPRNVGKSEHCLRKAILSKHSSWRELRRSQAAASVQKLVKSDGCGLQRNC